MAMLSTWHVRDLGSVGKFVSPLAAFATHYTDFLGNKGAGLKKETRNAEKP